MTNNIVLGLRVIQILSIAMIIVGFIWSSGDIITSMIPEESIINPISILMMLYGSMGSISTEALIRHFNKKKVKSKGNGSESQ